MKGNIVSMEVKPGGRLRAEKKGEMIKARRGRQAGPSEVDRGPYQKKSRAPLKNFIMYLLYACLCVR